MVLKRFLYCLNSINDDLLEFDNIDIVDKNAFILDSNMKAIKFNEKLNQIKESAFEECRELKIVILGDNPVLEETSYWPFEAIIIADKSSARKEEEKKENTLTIQSKAFYNCSKLLTVILPDNKNVIIEKDAFMGCTSLRTVVFGSGKAEIHDQSFIGCNNVSFVCPKDSDAERFAREHGIKIINV